MFYLKLLVLELELDNWKPIFLSGLALMDGKLNIRSAHVFSETLSSLLILIFFVNSISDPILAIMLMPNL